MDIDLVARADEDSIFKTCAKLQTIIKHMFAIIWFNDPDWADETRVTPLDFEYYRFSHLYQTWLTYPVSEILGHRHHTMQNTMYLVEQIIEHIEARIDVGDTDPLDEDMRILHRLAAEAYPIARFIDLS